MPIGGTWGEVAGGILGAQGYPTAEELQAWIAQQEAQAQAASAAVRQPGYYVVEVPSTLYPGQTSQVFYDPRTGNMYNPAGGQHAPTAAEYDAILDKLANKQYGVFDQSLQLVTPDVAGMPTIQQSPEERLATQYAEQRTGGLLGALEAEKAAGAGRVRREAFAPVARRGFGISGMAERDVGEALGRHEAQFARKAQQVRTEGLKGALEELRLREPFITPG